jgi:hypothetical protein
MRNRQNRTITSARTVVENGVEIIDLTLDSSDTEPDSEPKHQNAKGKGSSSSTGSGGSTTKRGSATYNSNSSKKLKGSGVDLKERLNKGESFI